MLLKIFTKRSKGGKLVGTNLRWKDVYLEANRIMMSPTDNGFEYHVDADIESGIKTGDINDKTHGYELFNNAGVCIERFVTTSLP